MPIPSAATEPALSNGHPGPAHAVSVVVPVYRGEETIAGLVAELHRLAEPTTTPAGATFAVTEIVLVHDHGPDRSDVVLRQLDRDYERVRVVWLSRNFGQDAATIAGMAAARGEWIVTMDEDGQHDPGAIGGLLDTALESGAALVYASPTNPAPHGPLRNAASRGSKWLLANVLSADGTQHYQSYRLVLGEIARSVAAYAGSEAYLDVALGWIAGDVATSPVALREEGGRRSGYRLRTLASHFWRMVLSSGTKGLRLVSLLGFLFGIVGFCLTVYIVIAYLFLGNGADVRGWASTMVVMLFGFGGILFSLGVIAEYIGVSVKTSMGKPPYLIVSDPAAGPLGRGETTPTRKP